MAWVPSVRAGARTTPRVDDAARRNVFAATAEPSEHPASSVFASAGEFADFMERGVSSYGPSRHRGRLTMVDLVKDATYEPLGATGLAGSAIEPCLALGATFNSARTSGHRYEWTDRGMTRRPDGP